MIKPIAIIIFCYLLGNISTSLLVSKLWANIDIRKYGSGNAGATNVVRTLGLKAGIITFLGDVLKGVIAVLIARKLGGENIALLSGIAVVAGHNWPILFGFKGGKGISTTIGVALTINLFGTLICIIFGVLIIIKTRYISLASILSICLFPVILLTNDTKYFIFGLILAMMAIFRHRTNIKRLVEGTESKFGQKTGVK